MKRNHLPSKEELIAFIRERSGKVGAREIARAFGAKNADRAALNRMLRELADEGLDRPTAQASAPCRHIAAGGDGRHHRPRPRRRPSWRGRPNGTRRRTALRRSSISPRRGAPIPAKSPASATARCFASRRPASMKPARASSRFSTAPSIACSGFFAVCPAAAGGWRRSTRSSSAASLRFPRAQPRAPSTAISSPSKSRAVADSVSQWPRSLND